ncbi:MAG: helicase HerA-like domain-containing protein, partial [Haloechinothrix sp.]
QHALRAFTPAEQKAVRSAAQTFRKNPNIDTEQAIMQLGIGEALVSTLDEKGQPSMVELTLVEPPNARVGPITEAERKAVINASPVRSEYEEVEDRESAYEILHKRTAKRTEAAAQGDDEAPRKKSGAASRSDGFWTTLSKTVIRTVVPAATRVLEQQIRRGMLGGIKRGG